MAECQFHAMFWFGSRRESSQYNIRQTVSGITSNSTSFNLDISHLKKVSVSSSLLPELAGPSLYLEGQFGP